LTNQQKKLKKEINKLSQSYRILESTGDDKRFLDLSSGYMSDRNRIHKEILHKYSDLFAVVQGIRKLSVLGVQNVDLLVYKNEDDSQNCIKRYHAINSLMIKYIEVFDEIICLIENGFPDGAMQRWRTLLEYSIIIIFILEQGEEVAEAYSRNFLKSIEGDLHPRMNFAWAKVANCFKEEKQITITKLFDNLIGIDTVTKKRFLAMYKLTSQSIHGSSFGVNLSFNDHISIDINDLDTKNANHFNGGVRTVITHTMILFHPTFKLYFDAFPDAGMNLKNLWKELFKEYVKVYKRLLEK
jgi:hypothetical protein